MKHTLRIVALLVFLFAIMFDLTQAAEDPHIEMFSPQGTVKGVRQVQARFSEQMVPFGDLRSELTEPFAIQCPEQGTPRWADGKTWVYDFAKDLSAGIRCVFTVKPGLKTLSGQEITGQKRFTFSTGGPAIISSIPYEGTHSIDEAQIFILVLDGEPTEESLLSHVSFAIEGIYERVGIRIVSGEERELILNKQYADAERPQMPLVLLQAKQRFPAEARVSLIWGQGVLSRSGVPTEQDQVLAFKTRSAFAATFHCERENPQTGCIPITPMSLRFSAPVSWIQARAIVLQGADGKQWKPESGEKENERAFVSSVTFKGLFPENTDFRLEIPPELTDDAGRRLVNAERFPLAVRTAAYPPLAKFAGRFGILERKANPMLPVTLRNLEPAIKASMLRVGEEEDTGEQTKETTEKIQAKVLRIPPEQSAEILFWLRKIYQRGWNERDESIFDNLDPAVKPENFSIPKPYGAKAFEVVGILLHEPGFYVVEIESAVLGAALLGKPKPMFVPTTALVTNFSVHLKWEGASSLVWVTTLDTGQPVPDALVSIQDCTGRVVGEGQTDANGVMHIAKLPVESELPRCGNYALSRGLFITAQVADDMAFVHSSWDEGIEPWRFQLPYPSYQGPITTHTILGRSLLRAGETIHMKHILRKQIMTGFAMIPETERPKTVVIQHVGSEQKYEFPLEWDARGIAETSWEIPKEAKLGLYEVFLLKAGDEVWNGWLSGQFRVEEFRVPLMKGIIQFPAKPLVSPTAVTVDLAVKYLAGGAASLLPITFRYQVQPRYVKSFEDFEGFVFANGPVQEGLIQEGVDQEEEQQRSTLQSIDLSLDQSGTARTTITNLPQGEIPLEIVAELEFKDPNGEIQTVSTRTPLWPAKKLVGIKPDAWASAKESLTFQVAVADIAGNPVPQAPVTVDLLQRKTYSHRKRLIGGFYAYEHFAETQRIDTVCTGKTDDHGLLTCNIVSPVSGNVILQATTTDDSGSETVAHQDVWVAGKEDWWFAVEDDDRMDILPEKKRYEPGETARFQVRMPFREATALITVEREGVMEAFVEPLSGKEPVIEIPIQGSYAPNVFVSVLAVRGRVSAIQPTATIDLGKPAFKLGIAEINVGWKAHELKVKVSSDRAVYQVREKAQVHIEVKTADGEMPPPGSEVAVAAVDEGLLELMPNTSWQLLEAMMRRRGYAVRTATAQMHVVGKRHFGLKALPQGGGGGKQITRELFDTLLLWRGRVPLDANGEASVEIPLNDSLTSFRITAIATGGVGLFGTGSTAIRSTQDLMILSGIAPVVREGDRYWSEITLRNTTERHMEVTVSAHVEGLPESLPPRTVSLAPGEAKDTGWEITAPMGVSALHHAIEATEAGGSSDKIAITQKVVPVVPVRPLQATITRIEGDMHLAVEQPPDALPHRGGVGIAFRSTLADGMPGVTAYMLRYPYTCLEQKVSQAIALQDESRWKRLLAILPAHLDADGLVKYFPSLIQGSDVLTAYLLAITHEAGWEIPGEIQEKMESGLHRFVEGKILRSSALPTVDLALRKLTAVEALSRLGKAEPQLLTSIALTPNLWPTSAVIDWFNILQRVPDIPQRERRIQEAKQILRSRLNFQGTIMGFSTEASDSLWWLMVSEDTNAVRFVLSLLEAGEWKEDMPRLVRGALGRQKRGAWDLTVANAWGVLAMAKFAQVFESIPVSGTSTATLAAHSQRLDWSSSSQGESWLFVWPSHEETLSIHHAGTGKPWVTVQSLAAIPLTKPLASGYTIKKTWIPIAQERSSLWSRGDIVRIRLEIEAQADMTWVVVNDPIPAGASILGSGLGRDSLLATQGEESKGWVWPAFEERSFEAFRAYYAFVPKGEWMVEYTLRLNNEGIFYLPPTRVEALYAPEMFGEIPNANIEVHRE